MTPEAVLSALSNYALLCFDGSNWHLTSPHEQVPTAVASKLLQQKLLEPYERSSFGTFYRLRKPMDHSIFSLAATFSGNPDFISMREQAPFTQPTSGLSWTAREILFGLYIAGSAPISASEINYAKRFWKAGWVRVYVGTTFMWALTDAMRNFIMADLQKEPSKPTAAVEETIKLEELDL